MSKAEGEIIVVKFTESITNIFTETTTGDINTDALAVEGQEPLYVKYPEETLGPLIGGNYIVKQVIAGDTEYEIKIILEPVNSFKNVEGGLTITYDKLLGNLEGLGGVVENFTEVFTPTDLVRVPNPLFEENINASIPLADFNVTLNALIYSILGIGEYGIDSTANQGDRYMQEIDDLSLIHISEPTRLRRISYAVFCLKK